jgi:hypothetical protein
VIELSPIDRYSGALLGLVVNDAVETTAEFNRPGTLFTSWSLPG